MWWNTWMPWGIGACVFLCLFLLVRRGMFLLLRGGVAYRDHIASHSQAELESLYSAVDPEKFSFFALLFMIGMLVLCTLAFQSFWGILVGIPLGYFLPRLYLRILLRQRRSFFIRQLPDAISLMANAMKAGNSFVQSLETVAAEMEGPVAQEFHYLLRRHKMGQSIRECLQELAIRIKNDDLTMVITASLVSMQVGSNLAEMFEKLARTMRQRTAMQNKIKSLTSQGKMQGVVVGLLPVGLLGVVYLIQPRTMDTFLNSFAGGLLLSLGLILEIMGIFFIRKIVRIDV